MLKGEGGCWKRPSGPHRSFPLPSFKHPSWERVFIFEYFEENLYIGISCGKSANTTGQKRSHQPRKWNNFERKHFQATHTDQLSLLMMPPLTILSLPLSCAAKVSDFTALEAEWELSLSYNPSLEWTVPEQSVTHCRYIAQSLDSGVVPWIFLLHDRPKKRCQFLDILDSSFTVPGMDRTVLHSAVRTQPCSCNLHILL